MMFASKTPQQIDACRAVGDHLARQDHRWQECPVMHDAPPIDQHNEPNPILVELRKQCPDWSKRHADVYAFDDANSAAWVEAGEPDDRPGTLWWGYEDHAWRVISRLAGSAS